MPALGGPGSQRAATRARAPQYRKRQKNLAKLPAPKRAAVYVPPARAYKAPAAARPTPKQLESARAQERQYKSQAGAVRRAAKTQKALGPGRAVRPEGKVLRRADIAPLVQEQAYKSLGKAVEKVATERAVKGEAKRKVKVGSTWVDAALVSKDPRVQKAAGLKAPGTLEKVISSPTLGLAALGNAPKDVKELAITTPTSLVQLGSTAGGGVVKSVKTRSLKPAAKASAEIGKGLVEPYKQLIKDPVKFTTEHPVTTALMLSPARAGVLRGAGRAARVAGKQTLKRPTATLEGTTLRQQRVGNRDIEKRARQTRADVAQPARIQTRPEVGRPAELDRRVDEAFDAGEQHKQRARASALRKAHQESKGMKRPERREHIEERLRLAGEGARQEVDRRFAREFGTHWEVHPDSGGVVKPKVAPELGGKLYTSRVEAERVAKALVDDPKVTWEPHVMKLEHVQGGEGYAVVPRQAHERFRWHKDVGTAPAVGAVTKRVAVKQFKKTVLPFSPKWLAGQVTEAAYRNLIHGSGVGSYIRARRVLKKLPKAQREELLGRTIQPAQFGATGPTGEFARGGGRTLAEEYQATPGAKPYVELATKAGNVAPVRALRAAHRRYSSTIFNDVNGTIERLSKTAMLGKEIKRSPLMERRLLGLSDKAMQEAADGLHSTATQVELGRALDRAYGKYSKFSPGMRETIAHQTPFIPWFRNMVQFNLSVLPKDHPMKTALLASYSAATEDWRKKQHLSYKDPKHAPDWLMASYPAFGGKVPVGRFGPFVPGEYAGAAGGQFTPMFQGLLMNLAGADWTGKELKGLGEEQKVALAAMTGAETFVPGVSQVNRVTGLGKRYVAGKKDEPTVGKGKQIDKALLDLLNPIKPIKPVEKKKKGRRRSTGLGGGGLGGGGL